MVLMILIIGAPNAGPNSNTSSGASYVIFGKADGSAVELSDIATDNNAGFVLNGVTMDDQQRYFGQRGWGMSTAMGLDDIIIGAPRSRRHE